MDKIHKLFTGTADCSAVPVLVLSRELCYNIIKLYNMNLGGMYYEKTDVMYGMPCIHIIDGRM